MSNGQIKLTGAIEPGVVADVMQFVSGRSDRVGYLLVHHADTDGRVWFKDGAMVAAECGKARDQEAIKRILGLTSGKFAFVDDNQVPERTIFEETTSVLLECFRQLDEAKSGEPEAPADIKPLVEAPDIPPPLAREPQPDDTSDGPTRAPTPRTTEMPRPTHPPPEAPRPTPSPVSVQAPDIPPPQPPAAGPKRLDSGPTWAPDPLGVAWPEPSEGATPSAKPALAPEPVIPETPVHGLSIKTPPPPPPAATPAKPPARRRTAIRFIRPILAAGMLLLLAAVAVMALWSWPQGRKTRGTSRPDDTPANPSDPAWARAVTSEPPVVIPNEAIRAAWPNLRFTGLTKIPGQRGLAIVNDQLIREGDVIEGVTIVSVTRTGLLTQCSGETRFLPFFISTENTPRQTGKNENASLGNMLRQAFGK